MATWIDCASSDACTLAFLIDALGEEHIVFGSDYSGRLGPLSKCLASINKQPDPGIKNFTDKNSPRLLHLKKFRDHGI